MFFLKHTLFLIFFLLSQLSLAVDYNEILSRASLITDGTLYTGFGFSREVINHSLFDTPLNPRDVDMAIINSSWSNKDAMKELKALGEIQNVKTMRTGIKSTIDEINEISQGFFVHVKIEDVIFDFKFFTSTDMAQERVWTNI